MELGDGETLIKQGAEARVYVTRFLGRGCVVKERFAKSYRHPQLDRKLNDSRLAQEARCLVRARKAGVAVPAVYHVDLSAMRLYLELLGGAVTVRDYIYAHPSMTAEEAQHLSKSIGTAIGRLHDTDIIHGDLTTSNMMVLPSGKLAMIDFGLSYVGRNADEDKAVDLYVLERAFLSTHSGSQELFDSVLEWYRQTSKKAPSVLSKLTQVRLRGRKKVAFG
eukprot:TRINITY_DN9580_c0_g1_i2.p1 TRINITY_DN9580_c0_g1~~TRINITY_DN9580_c0_g1_i2.p1  ORF type:complete len:229 (-),score=33.18 TRINITY_DN9580_c0_g1_i2:7-669(-)